MGFILLFKLVVSIWACGYTNGEETEPQDFEHSSNIWIRKLNMTIDNAPNISKFVVKLLYQSSWTQPEAGLLASAFGTEAVITHLYSLYGTKQLLPFRVANYAIFFNFYHGDMAIIHMLDSATGQYEAVELGGHSLKYFMVIGAGVYYSVDLDTHTDEEYILTGNTVYDGTTEPSTFLFGEWNKLLEEFPQHKNIINRLYERSPDYLKPNK